MGLRDLQYIYRARTQGPAKLVYFSLALARLRLKPISDLLSKWQEVGVLLLSQASPAFAHSGRMNDAMEWYGQLDVFSCRRCLNPKAGHRRHESATYL